MVGGGGKFTLRKEGGRIDGIFTTGQNDHFLERNERASARALARRNTGGAKGRELEGVGWKNSGNKHSWTGANPSPLPWFAAPFLSYIRLALWRGNGTLD